MDKGIKFKIEIESNGAKVMKDITMFIFSGLGTKRAKLAKNHRFRPKYVL